VAGVLEGLAELLNGLAMMTRRGRRKIMSDAFKSAGLPKYSESDLTAAKAYWVGLSPRRRQALVTMPMSEVETLIDSSYLWLTGRGVLKSLAKGGKLEVVSDDSGAGEAATYEAITFAKVGCLRR